MKYYVKTFGCQQNVSDSQRIKSAFSKRGMTETDDSRDADYVIINTCMVRQSAENRVAGLVNNLVKIKVLKRKKKQSFKIIVTGCMVGLAKRDTSGIYSKIMHERLPEVDEFVPIEEFGYELNPVRDGAKNAWLPISNGCNNFCSYCTVPYSRGKEISRPYEDIIQEADKLKREGYTHITLLGQNVNSYGSDLILNGSYPDIKPVFVKHLGKKRIPTLFPLLLSGIAEMGFESVSFMSSNPWDFSETLINVIATHKNIARVIHLPVQSGDSSVLKRMNRWYTDKEYLQLVSDIRKKIPDVTFTTDIVVGFCGETDKEFNNTVRLYKKVGFQKAYVSIYSPRYGTAAIKTMKDDVPYTVKKKRWCTLENLINKPNLKKAV